MARQRFNPRLVKLHRTYDVQEIASLFGIQRRTVWVWVRDNGLQPIDGTKPIIVHGQVLAEFLRARRAAAKRPCPPGTMYCCKCRAGREPALDMADFTPLSATSGYLQALCNVCGFTMHRRTRLAQIGDVLPGVEVRIQEGASHISGRPSLFLKRA